MSDERTIDNDLEMPKAVDGFIKTFNNTGFMTDYLDRFSQTFVDYSAGSDKPVMDIGAAYGVATLAALDRGASVISNDIDGRHLAVLEQRVPEHARTRLSLLCGEFPNLDIESDSLGAVLAARLFHFLDGDTIERSAQKLFSWLAPGGKVFIVAETPFVKTLIGFREEYKQRKESGDPFPGLIQDMLVFSPHATMIPKLGNWMDVDVLTRVFSASGFTIEECAYFARPEFPSWLQLDGQESVGLIARK